ncbi:MAG: hypothetical protein WCY82_09675 [Desulfotomaculaceae bacterium]
MTKGEFISQVHGISNLANNININVHEELGQEALKDLVDKLVNLVSLCQACLINNARSK